MFEAIKQAWIAFEAGEIPVGAVVVYNEKVISRAHNQVQMLKDPTAHAEMLAITSACNQIGSKYLKNCTLYVTLEPCIMCAGAMHWSQVSEIVFGAVDARKGFESFNSSIFNSKVIITKNILSKECEEPLKRFFEDLRS